MHVRRLSNKDSTDGKHSLLEVSRHFPLDRLVYATTRDLPIFLENQAQLVETL